VVAQFELAPQVAEGTRNSFEALRAAFAHGVFCYEIFTLVNDRGLLVFEQALRDRFVEHHQGTVTFVDPRDGSRQPVGAGTYQQMHDVLRRNRRWRLLLDDGQTLAFNGMLGDLRTWARRLGLLRGQRNRVIEEAIANLRNMAAHPGYHLTTPVDAARTLGDLAEIINHLWGVPNPRRPAVPGTGPARSRRDGLDRRRHRAADGARRRAGRCGGPRGSAVAVRRRARRVPARTTRQRPRPA
jgi:hypothetical protein